MASTEITINCFVEFGRLKTFMICTPILPNDEDPEMNLPIKQTGQQSRRDVMKNIKSITADRSSPTVGLLYYTLDRNCKLSYKIFKCLAIRDI